ncbi:MAG TPA: hypothetical protein VJ372_13745 [Pyrinomonadaceae bacterium]|jgi:hypothetical protein|nr:hypothetical protein [Pyrinomonadaceae bacterium]
MKELEVTVTDLTFPASLEDKYCKFRPLISIRYLDSNDKVQYAREALPGLGASDYWECEKDNKKKDDYVRHPTAPKVDTDRLDISKREILFKDLDIKSFERIELELFDVDIKVKWEKIMQSALMMLPPDVLTFVNPAMPVTLTLVKQAYEKASGKKVDDLEKSLITKLIGKDDGATRSIWVRSKDLPNPLPESVTVTGPGKQGDYSLTMAMNVR